MSAQTLVQRRVQRFVAALGTTAFGLLVLGSAAAQTPSDPYNYSRTSTFNYAAGSGLLIEERIEPSSPNLCVSKVYTHAENSTGRNYGNRVTTTTQSCSGASATASVPARQVLSNSVGPATQPVLSITPQGSQTINVAVAPGQFPFTSHVALTSAPAGANANSHSESRSFDPRFGVVTQLIGPNGSGAATSWRVDDFGRRYLETRADGTRTLVLQCFVRVFNATTGQMDLVGSGNVPSSSSDGCPFRPLTTALSGLPADLTIPAPAANEVPADAVRYEHSHLIGTAARNGEKISAYTRTYFDRAGRKLRIVTEGFDGGANTAASGNGLIAQDTIYDNLGMAVVTTQPYFIGTAAAGMTLTVYDALGRAVETYTAEPATARQVGGLAGNVNFPGFGPRQAARVQITHDGLVTSTRDDLGRVRTEEKHLDGKLVRATDPLGAQTVHQHDAFGNLVETKDPLGNRVLATFDIAGRRIVLNDPDAGVVVYCYDAIGQLKAQQTSNQRNSHGPLPCPTGLSDGTTASNIPTWTTMAYDRLGRLTQRVDHTATTTTANPELTSTFTYDSCTMGIGKLCSSVTSNGVSRNYQYDSRGRPERTRSVMTGGPAMVTGVSYDAHTGRVSERLHPTGLKTREHYTWHRGYLSHVTLESNVRIVARPSTVGGAAPATVDWTAGRELWRAQRVSAAGRLEQQTLGNGVVQTSTFDAATGRTDSIVAMAPGNVTAMSQRLRWDSAALVVERVDAVGASTGAASPTPIEVHDTLKYDALGRLTEYTVVGGTNGAPEQRTVTMQYNALGLLLHKSDVGNYTYPAQGVPNGRPHAVQLVTGIVGTSYIYDLNGNAITANAGKWRSISYTSFNLPDGQTTGGIAGASGTPRATWLYDENRQRVRETRTNAQGTRTTWYLHPDNQGGLGFEQEVAPGGTKLNRHYVSAGGMVVGVIVTSSADATGNLPNVATSGAITDPVAASPMIATRVEYWHKDHLGSTVATTDHAGAVTARYAYDPFGKRRELRSTYDPFGNIVIDWSDAVNHGNDRGYTGHEHLDELGLIHMNGRIYDPLIARFLEADPFIQDPTNLQSFDRYAYCFNSPMGCTDPSGYISLRKLWREIRPFVAIAAAVYFGPGGYAWGQFGILGMSGLGTGVGATIGKAATAGFISGAIASGDLKGAMQGAFSGAVFGGVGQGIAGMGGVAEIGEVAAVAMHGVAGCVTTVAGGGACGPGALSAAFSKTVAVSETLIGKDVVTGTIISAVAGGTGSVLGGGKFANGAHTGAFSYLFNQLGDEKKTGNKLEPVPDTPELRAAYDRLQSLADTAAANIDATCGWKCNLPWIRGTLIHGEFQALITSLGPASGFTAEVSYKSGVVVTYGTAGSSRADVVFGPVAAPTAAYDLKTGWAYMSIGQAKAYGANLPAGTPFAIVRPKGR